MVVPDYIVTSVMRLYKKRVSAVVIGLVNALAAGFCAVILVTGGFYFWSLAAALLFLMSLIYVYGIFNRPIIASKDVIDVEVLDERKK